MKTIQPHPSFEHVTPDEIANCWDEATRDIGRILWKGHKVYEEMTADYHKEDDWCPGSWVGEFNMATPKIWDAFTSEEKQTLNDMAERHKVAHDAWLESILAPYENCH